MYWDIYFTAAATALGVAIVAGGLALPEHRVSNALVAVGTSVIAAVLVQILVQLYFGYAA